MIRWPHRAWQAADPPAGQGLRGELRSLTGLRGCAAVLVMLYHFGLATSWGSPTTFVSRGYLWVDMFFVLSGFVIAYNYQGLFVGDYCPRTHLAFLGRRIARVYPLYAVVILESAALFLWRSNDPDLEHFSWVLVANLTMVQAWGIAPSFEGDAWSISTEWAAYLLFPLLAAVTLFRSRRLALAAGLVAVAAIVVLAATPGSHAFSFDVQDRHGPLDIYSSATAAPLVRCLAEFTLGLLTFRAAGELLRHRVAGADRAAIAAVAGALLLVAIPGGDAAAVILFAVLLLCLTPQQGIVVFLLGARIPYRLGEWSYALYLIHDKFVSLDIRIAAVLKDLLPFAAVVALVVTSGLAIGCAAAVHAWIERPCRRLLQGRIVGWRGGGRATPPLPRSHPDRHP